MSLQESIANLPGSLLMAYVFFGLVALALIVMAYADHKDKRAADRAALVRSVKAHPAGRALPAQDSRHMDRPGYDWVNGPL